MLALLLGAQLGAFVPPSERLFISADDATLGRAIVRSANQHVVGSVELLPPGAPPPPRVLRLRVRCESTGRLTLVLSRGAKLSVARVLRIAGSHGFFDRAEVVAMVIDDMRARLNEELARAPAASALAHSTGSAVLSSHPHAAGPSAAPESAPSARAALAASSLSASLSFAPSSTTEPTAEDLSPAPAPTPQDALRDLTAVTTAPQLRTEPAPLILAPIPIIVPPAPAAGQRWRLGVGIALEVVGLTIGGLGAASLALDGHCVDGGVPCDYRFDGRTAGAIEAAFGSAAVITGIGLLAALGFERRSSPPRAALFRLGSQSFAVEF